MATKSGNSWTRYQTCESTLRKSHTSIDPETVGSCITFWSKTNINQQKYQKNRSALLANTKTHYTIHAKEAVS